MTRRLELTLLTIYGLGMLIEWEIAGWWANRRKRKAKR